MRAFLPQFAARGTCLSHACCDPSQAPAEVLCAVPHSASLRPMKKGYRHRRERSDHRRSERGERVMDCMYCWMQQFTQSQVRIQMRVWTTSLSTTRILQISSRLLQDCGTLSEVTQIYPSACLNRSYSTSTSAPPADLSIFVSPPL